MNRKTQKQLYKKLKKFNNKINKKINELNLNNLMISKNNKNSQKILR